MLDALEAISEPDPRPTDALRDELQALSRRVAFAPGTWSAQDRLRVQAIFDERAPNWFKMASPAYLSVLGDALARGGVARGGRCLEIGSGTGLQTPALARHFDHVVSIDISPEMSARTGRSLSLPVLCDAAELSFAKASFDALVLVNMFVFPAEYLRVLRDQGAVVLASSLRGQTPIYLAPADLLASLEARSAAEFIGRHAQIGSGEWTVLARAPRP